MTRRSFVPALAGLAACGAVAQSAPGTGRLKQSATRGCFKGMTIEEAASAASKLGLKGLDLISSEHWPVLKKYGLIATMTPGGGTIADGINKKENHAKIEQQFRENIPNAAAAGMPNVIALAGTRKGMPDEESIENSVLLLNRVKALAEDKGVTICMELLNSKVDHPDYVCDHTKWGVEVCKRVNSPRVKLLYDIYHMQIMEGDIIRTIRENIQWIGHFHTAGNPGRHEIDATQELNYKAIAKAVADLNYTGYFAHEYGPLRDPVKSMAEAIEICTV